MRIQVVIYNLYVSYQSYRGNNTVTNQYDNQHFWLTQQLDNWLTSKSREVIFNNALKVTTINLWINIQLSVI